VTYSPHFGICSTIEITATFGSDVDVDFTVKHIQVCPIHVPISPINLIYALMGSDLMSTDFTIKHTQTLSLSLSLSFSLSLSLTHSLSPPPLLSLSHTHIQSLEGENLAACTKWTIGALMLSCMIFFVLLFFSQSLEGEDLAAYTKLTIGALVLSCMIFAEKLYTIRHLDWHEHRRGFVLDMLVQVCPRYVLIGPIISDMPI
jgi:hypothetical protein